MSKEHRWLATEIERWVAEGIIAPAQAQRLRERYAMPAAAGATGLSWGLIVFFSIGAIVVGLGVILLFAYNWAAMPKAGKLALVLGALIAAHAGGLALRGGAAWRPVLGDGLQMLGTMLFGAGIWLVAQIYHIDEHFPTGFLVWGLGALALAWAAPSIAQAILATIVLTIRGVVEVVAFSDAPDWGVVLLVAGVGPLVWRLRSSVLLAVLLAGLYVHVIACAGLWGGAGMRLVAAMALSVACIGLGAWIRGGPMPARAAAVLRFFGLTGFMVCAYMLTFEDMARGVLRATLRHDELAPAVHVYRWSLLTLALGIWSILFVRSGRRLPSLEDWIYPLGLLAVAGMMIAGFHWGAGMIALVFNLVVLGISALWIVRGCREGRLRSVVLGSVVLGLLVFARYFDLFDSLAARGLAFVLFGGALFAEGFYYRRLRQADAAAGEVVR